MDRARATAALITYVGLVVYGQLQHNVFGAAAAIAVRTARVAVGL